MVLRRSDDFATPYSPPLFLIGKIEAINHYLLGYVIEVVAITELYSKGGKKQIWPDEYIHSKPRNIGDIDWSKGDGELADEITIGDPKIGPKSPNNWIRKWFREHRPKNIKKPKDPKKPGSRKPKPSKPDEDGPPV